MKQAIEHKNDSAIAIWFNFQTTGGDFSPTEHRFVDVSPFALHVTDIS